MFPNSTQGLVHLQRNPPPKSEAELPRGECRHVQRTGGYDTPWSHGQRCFCQGFSLDKQQVVGTTCECGHPAWSHVQQPMGVVTYEEHEALAEEVRRFKDDYYTNYQSLRIELARTQQELMEQRAVNNERERVFKFLEARMYQNMKDLKIILDDKLDGVIDQQHAFQRKLMEVEDTTMEHDERLEKLLRAADRTSREITPTANATDEQPMETDEYPEKADLSWSVKVVMTLRKSQKFAYDVDSTAYRRLQSRNLVKDLTFAGRDSISFHTVIEKNFGDVLRRRPWVPLIGYRTPRDFFGRIFLKQLPLDHTYGQLWDYFFLDHHCIVHDKMQGDILHIALRDTELSWSEIKSLPCVFGFHESSWAYDTELDGPLKFLQPPTPARAPSSASGKSEVSDFVYDYSPSPPPYTSQRYTMDPDVITPVPLENGFQSPLDMLAQASATISPSITDSFPLPLSKQQSHAPSLRSMASDSTDDVDSEHLHRNKIRKLRPKLSEPFMSSRHHQETRKGTAENLSHPNLPIGNGSSAPASYHNFNGHSPTATRHHGKMRSHATTSSGSSGSTSASSGSTNGSASTAPPQAQQQTYYSGRSKRKMPVREKQKEPLQFKLPSLLHHRSNRSQEEAA